MYVVGRLEQGANLFGYPAGDIDLLYASLPVTPLDSAFQGPASPAPNGSVGSL